MGDAGAGVRAIERMFAPRPVEPVDDKTFLRGTQLTDAAGAVRFRMIYPGWYSGRTPHVHLKVRVGAKAATTQLYFPDEVTNAVYAHAPYDRHPNRDTTNATDRFLGPIGVPPDVDDGARRGRLRRHRHRRVSALQPDLYPIRVIPPSQGTVLECRVRETSSPGSRIRSGLTRVQPDAWRGIGLGSGPFIGAMRS